MCRRATFPVMLVLSLMFVPIARGQVRSVDRWEEDVRYLVHQLETRHPSLYHSVDRRTFVHEAERIITSADGLRDHEIVVQLQRLVSLVGDGHTTTAIEWDPQLPFHDYPLEVLVVSDGVLVVSAPRAVPDLVGSRILAFDGTSVDEVLRRARGLVSKDNQYSGVEEIADYLRVGEILHALGVTDSARRMRLTVAKPDGDNHVVPIEAVPRGETAPRMTQAEWAGSVRWLARRDVPYWYELLPDQSAVYVGFNSADISRAEQVQFEAFCSDIEEGGVEATSIVVDLRWNTGGSFQRVQCLVRTLIALERLHGSRIVALIGPRTFSAGVLFAAELALHTEAVFVGAPTGGKPNHFSGRGMIRLPNSRMIVAYSNAYWQSLLPGDDRPAFMPDLVASPTVSEIWQVRDVAFELALADVPRPSIASALRPILEGAGAELAVAEYQRLRIERRNHYDFGEDELNRLGYDLLESDKPLSALAMLELNAAVFPWSANAHDSLADGLLANGKNTETITALCRAFQIDRDFDRFFQHATQEQIRACLEERAVRPGRIGAR